MLIFIQHNIFSLDFLFNIHSDSNVELVTFYTGNATWQHRLKQLAI